jgi:hypothetical protein
MTAAKRRAKLPPSHIDRIFPPRGRGRPTHPRANAILFWLAVEIKRDGRSGFVTRASELVAEDMRNHTNDKISGRRIRALYHEAERLRADPKCKESVDKWISDYRASAGFKAKRPFLPERIKNWDDWPP